MSVEQKSVNFWCLPVSSTSPSMTETVDNCDQEYLSDSSSEFELIDDENEPKPMITINRCDESDLPKKEEVKEKETEEMINTIIAELESYPDVVDEPAFESEELSLENTPEEEKTEEMPPKKDENLTKTILNQIQTKIENYENVFIKFTEYGTWVNYDDKNIDWLKFGFHLKTEKIGIKFWMNQNCPCQKEKNEEEQKKKIIEAIRQKIENRQSFAMVFSENNTADIYELNHTDIKWIDYINFQKKYNKSFLGYDETQTSLEKVLHAFVSIFVNILKYFYDVLNRSPRSPEEKIICATVVTVLWMLIQISIFQFFK